MDADAFEATVERLYAGRPGDFIAARDRAVKRARADDDRELAEQLKRLRRPTAAAALLNRQVRSGDTSELTALAELGERLRAAQRGLDAAAMRALSAERSPRIAAVLNTIAADGDEITASVREQLTQTLTALVADADAARAVLSGRLVAALSYSGFGEVDLRDAVAAPLRAEKAAAVESTSAATKAAARAAAQRHLNKALGILDKAREAETSARGAAELADRSLDAARRTAASAHDRVNQAAAARATAEETVAAAREGLTAW
ncbi:hypothetical protein [Flexivirga caeni]|uniref:Uncharacterized protein n=1 Tax=Flexivirga caeni TaxID=2294115 RepID=A0A3M9M312_9MICO|nr:hypothetical protein [Flexivirga caeni]RNI19906.1 hypothetical protein EFY87_15925 [Flexivirga caeni]